LISSSGTQIKLGENPIRIEKSVTEENSPRIFMAFNGTSNAQTIVIRIAAIDMQSTLNSLDMPDASIAIRPKLQTII
jgi:hypothetical protein